MSSYTVARRQALLDDWRERGNLRSPTDGIVLLEAVEEGLEHAIELRRGLVPAHDGVAEP